MQTTEDLDREIKLLQLRRERLALEREEGVATRSRFVRNTASSALRAGADTALPMARGAGRLGLKVLRAAFMLVLCIGAVWVLFMGINVQNLPYSFAGRAGWYFTSAAIWGAALWVFILAYR